MARYPTQVKDSKANAEGGADKSSKNNNLDTVANALPDELITQPKQSDEPTPPVSPASPASPTAQPVPWFNSSTTLQEFEQVSVNHRAAYRAALRQHNNPFHCLPASVRERIYTLALEPCANAEYAYTEVPTFGEIAVPTWCEIDDFWFFEVVPIFLQTTTFVIINEDALWTFIVNIRGVLPRGPASSYVRYIQFEGLELWERGVFASSATKMLRRCINVVTVLLVLDFQTLPWKIINTGAQELNVDKLNKEYQLDSLFNLEQLRGLVLDLKPSMALKNKITAMEKQRKANEATDGNGKGVDSFWGLAEWLEHGCAKQGRKVRVSCPDPMSSFA